METRGSSLHLLGSVFPGNAFPEITHLTCPVGAGQRGGPELCGGLRMALTDFRVTSGVVCLETQILGLPQQNPEHLCSENEIWDDGSLFNMRNMRSSHSLLRIALG